MRHGYKEACVQRGMGTKRHGYKEAWVQRGMCTKRHGCKETWVQRGMGTKRHGYKEAWVQRGMGTKRHGYKEAWVQRGMGTKRQRHGYIEPSHWLLGYKWAWLTFVQLELLEFLMAQERGTSNNISCALIGGCEQRMCTHMRSADIENISACSHFLDINNHTAG